MKHKCGQVLVTRFEGPTSACITEWYIREPHGKDGQQRGPRLGSPVPGQCVDEWDGQSRHADNDQRGGTAAPPTTLSASHDGRWVQRFTWAFCLVSVLAWCYQIITKEIEVNEWKRKYEECRVEVTEMRLGQRDVFTRVLQSEIQVKNVNKCHQFVWENFLFLLLTGK